jgi:pilus assembly protein CpaB
MDIRRLSLALFISLVLSAGATYLLYSRIQRQRAATPATMRIVAAIDELPAGTPLAPSNLKVVDWPASMPLAGAFSKPEQIVGRSLIYPISINQPIVENDLAAPGSGLGLSVKIPEGMRAISVRSNDVVGVAGFVYPGSHVDVLLTYRPDNAAAPLTQTILQNVEVLTAGETLEPDPKGRPEPVNVVTLLLSPRDAQKLVLATQQGSVQFVLRNGADQNKPDSKPVLTSQLVVDVAPPAPAPKGHVASTPIAPKPVRSPEFYSVETIAGDKHTVEKF